MNMHTIVLLGRATKDVEAKESKDKKKYAKFSVAVNELVNKEEKVTFYEVLVFGNSAEKATDMIKKGDTVMVMGKPEVEAYMSKKDKEPKASVTVLAESWKLLK